MKIKSFIKKAQNNQNNLFDPKMVNKEVINVIKNYSVDQIYTLLNSKKFVAPDIISLLYHNNFSNFQGALIKYIERILKLNQTYKEWIQFSELQQSGEVKWEDLESEIEIVAGKLVDELLVGNGAIAQIARDGSRAQSFNYSSNPQQKVELKNSLSIDENNITVPTCPIDESLGKFYPLWKIKKDSVTGEIETQIEKNRDGKPISGNPSLKQQTTLDKKGRCLSIDAIKYVEIEEEEVNDLVNLDIDKKIENPLIDEILVIPILDEEVRFLVTDSTHYFIVDLTDGQINQLKNNKRGFYIDDEKNLYFRCTYIADLPNFSSFLSYRGILAPLSKSWNKFKKEFGWDLDPKKQKEFELLQEKKYNLGGLTDDEEKKLKYLSKYLQEKESKKIKLPETPNVADESGDKGQYIEKYVSEDVEVVEERAEQQDVMIAIKQNFSAKELELIERIKKDGDARMIFFNSMKNWKDHHKVNSGKKRANWDLSNLGSMEANLEKLAREISSKNIKDIKLLECIICGNKQKEDNYCMVSKKMIDILYDNYLKVENYQDYVNSLKNLDENSKKHLESSKFNNYTSDLFPDIFSYDSEGNLIEVEEEVEEKMDKEDFLNFIRSNLPKDKQVIFFGLNLKTIYLQDEQENQNVENIKKELSDIISNADSTIIESDEDDDREVTLLEYLAEYIKE